MKRIKKILIPIITSISSVALIAPLASSVTNKAIVSTNNASKVDNSLNAIKYKYVTFATTNSDVSFVGNTKYKVMPGHIFASVGKPTVVHKKSYELKGWATKETSPAESDFYTANTQINSDITLYPIFTTSTVVIQGDDTILSSQSSKPYKAYVESSTKAKDVTWTVASRGSGVSTDTKIGETTGILEAGLNDAGTVTIQATDNTTGEKATKVITIKAPYDESTGVWTTHLVDGKTRWVRLENNDIAAESPKTQIQYYPLGVSPIGAQYLNKSDLDSSTIYIGRDLTSLPDNFLNGWGSFNGTINFGDNQSKCTVIGKCFMQECTTFNQKLKLPSSIKYIDDGFLYGCKAFNNGTATYGSFAIPNKIVSIGSDFLNGCESFNRDLTIPETVTHVGDFFMTDCNAMESTITINTPIESFDAYAPTSYTLTTKNDTTASYTNGVKIGGEYAVEFVNRFVDRDSSNPYRKLRVDFTSCGWGGLAWYVEKYESGQISEAEFCKHFVGINYNTGNYFQITNLNNFVGQYRGLPIFENDNYHAVIVADVNHDTIAAGETHAGQKALFTFDMQTVICKDIGTPELSAWNSNDTAPDFLNSTLRKNLTGEGTGEQTWDKTALDLILDESTGTPSLEPYIKKVSKTINKTTGTGTWTSDTYDTKLFILTASEMGETSAIGAEGAAYAYYSTLATGLKYKVALGDYSATPVEFWTSSIDSYDEFEKAYHSSAFKISLYDDYESEKHAIAPAFCI